MLSRLRARFPERRAPEEFYIGASDDEDLAVPEVR